MKRILSTILLALSVGVAFAEVPPVYKLPEPIRQQDERREDVADLLRVTVEVTEICPEPLDHAFTLQEVSNAVEAFQRKSQHEWRPAVVKALGENTEEVELYMVNDEGVYRYEPRERTMMLCAKGDFRKAIAEKHPQFGVAKLFLIGKSSGNSIRSQLMRQEMQQMLEESDETPQPADEPAPSSEPTQAKTTGTAVSTTYEPGPFLLILGATDYRFTQLRSMRQLR